MKTIVLFGAGRSAGSLILFLDEYCAAQQHRFILCDVQKPQWIQDLTATQFEIIQLENDMQRQSFIKSADVVLSLLPPALHTVIIKDCIQFKKHFINASYISPEAEELKNKIAATGKLFLLECGLDPGIDHMSAMEMTSKLREDGYTINSFLSFTGGLVAPESDTNPWHYKISWNPRNVVLAGLGTARFRQEGSDRLVPYTQLFKRLFSFEVKGLGPMDGYANRDSLSYQELYGMQQIDTFIRGTLRYPDYCQGWHLLVQLGLTDDAVALPSVKTWKELLDVFLPPSSDPFEKRISDYLNLPIESKELKNLLWLGIATDKALPPHVKTPAQALQCLIEEKWKLETNDLDLIAMQHEWVVTKNGNEKKVISSLVLKGRNNIETAMAQTVGLPMGIAAALLLEEKLTATGLHRPLLPEIYEPILQRLEMYGIVFK
jgi:saccharopine dehydrogenase-like NADP-dependent oxidoreductase